MDDQFPIIYNCSIAVSSRLFVSLQLLAGTVSSAPPHSNTLLGSDHPLYSIMYTLPTRSITTDRWTLPCAVSLDVHLPLSEKNRTPSSSSVQVQPFVIARIAYPSQEDSTHAPSSSSSFPFLPVSVAEQYCNLFMQKEGAPPLIKAMTFLLHHWRLIRIHRVSSSSSSDLSSSSQTSSDRKPIMKL